MRNTVLKLAAPQHRLADRVADREGRGPEQPHRQHRGRRPPFQATNAAADVSASTQGAVVPGLVCLVA